MSTTKRKKKVTEAQPDNVVSLDSVRGRSPKERAVPNGDWAAEIQARNAANAERVREERARDNKATLRQYRIRGA